MWFSGVLVLFVGLTQALFVPSKRDFDPFHDECGIEVEDRQECGRMLLGELQCLSRSCCWDGDPKLPPGAIRCFAAKRMLTERCTIKYENKDDCGYYGITEGECLGRGCCYRPGNMVNDPDCFHPVYVRLVDGPTEKSGRVEVKHEGKWGTVCDDGFGKEEADVVCRSLGYAKGVPKIEAHYGEGILDILLDDLQCKGDESTLKDCKHNGWGSHNCGHSEDAGVICLNKDEEEPESEESEEYGYGDQYDDGSTSEEDFHYRSMKKNP